VAWEAMAVAFSRTKTGIMLSDPVMVVSYKENGEDTEPQERAGSTTGAAPTENARNGKGLRSE